jgi:fibrillarin-like pre-rRNA processing protein
MRIEARIVRWEKPMEFEMIFDGVYRIGGRLATENLARGSKAYGEALVDHEGAEYRMWTPYRSKLSAAIMNGMHTMKIKRGCNVLYIGAATGTTASHVSDIIGKEGKLYGIELSERNIREFIGVCESRPNMLPILADADLPESYLGDVARCDVIYQDVSARNQGEILLKNSAALKKGGYAYFVIKSQSIDISKAPDEVYRAELDAVGSGFEVVERVGLEPYDSMHLFAVLKKR